MDNLNYLFNLPVGKHKLGNQGCICVSGIEGEKRILIETDAGTAFLSLYKKQGQIARSLGLCSNDANKIINEAVWLHRTPQLIYLIVELLFLWSIICTIVSIIATVVNPSNLHFVLISFFYFSVSLAYLKGHKND